MPGNSPDLNPIENLWSILKSRLEESEPADSLETLKIQLKHVWSEIEPNLLERIVSGMPDRIRKCIQLQEKAILSTLVSRNPRC